MKALEPGAVGMLSSAAAVQGPATAGHCAMAAATVQCYAGPHGRPGGGNFIPPVELIGVGVMEETAR